MQITRKDKINVDFPPLHGEVHVAGFGIIAGHAYVLQNDQPRLLRCGGGQIHMQQ